MEKTGIECNHHFIKYRRFWFDAMYSQKNKNHKIRKKLIFITSLFFYCEKILNKVSISHTLNSLISLNKSCENVSLLVINWRYKGERNFSLNEKWELESDVFIRTNNRRYLRYKNKNEVICSDTINIFFLNYDKKQMLRKWLLFHHHFFHINKLITFLITLAY